MIEAIGDLFLDSGTMLRDVQIAYETIGTLAPARDNVILLLHGFTSGPDTILPAGEATEGSWRDLIGRGKAIDIERYFVICPNALGSTYGSTGAASIDPANGEPYGSSFPPLTMRDVVAGQHALLARLQIDRLVAVVGSSFGGLQALQWAVCYPDFMRGVVVALAALGDIPVNVGKLRAALASDPHWNDGDYYSTGPLIDTLTGIRIGMLHSYGVDQALSVTVPDPATRQRLIADRAHSWAVTFDANALLTIMSTMGSFDIRRMLDRIKVRVLYVLSRTDPIFPPTLAPGVMAEFARSGVAAEYFEIDSAAGHSAASSDAALWAPVLQRFVENL